MAALSTTPESRATVSIARIVTRAAAMCGLMFLFAALILLAAYVAYRMAVTTPWLRTECLVAGIVAGFGSTACLAGAMHYLDMPLMDYSPPWYVRWPLMLNKRVVLVLQLATTALALGSAFILIFGFKIPGGLPAPL